MWRLSRVISHGAGASSCLTSAASSSSTGVVAAVTRVASIVPPTPTAPVTTSSSLPHQARSLSVKVNVTPAAGGGVKPRPFMFGVDDAAPPRKSARPPGSTKETLKRRVAIVLCFQGSGYCGMQWQPEKDGAAGVENALERALYKAGLISEANYGAIDKIGWNRSSRTDKGVSAIGLVVSAKLELLHDKPSAYLHLADQINHHLPPDVRVVTVLPAQRRFQPRSQCAGRRYRYMLPVSALPEPQARLIEDAAIRLSSMDVATQDRVLHTPEYDGTTWGVPPSLLQLFEGSHNWHNFSGRVQLSIWQEKLSKLRMMMSEGINENEARAQLGLRQRDEWAARKQQKMKESHRIKTGQPVNDDHDDHDNDHDNDNDEKDSHAAGGAKEMTLEDEAIAIEQHEAEALFASKPFVKYHRDMTPEELIETREIEERRWPYRNPRHARTVTKMRARPYLHRYTDARGVAQQQAFLQFTVVGDSFVFNQIRHMIGGVIGHLYGVYTAPGMSPNDTTLLQMAIHSPWRIHTLLAPAEYLMLDMAPHSFRQWYPAYKYQTGIGSRGRVIQFEDVKKVGGDAAIIDRAAYNPDGSLRDGTLVDLVPLQGKDYVTMVGFRHQHVLQFMVNWARSTLGDEQLTKMRSDITALPLAHHDMTWLLNRYTIWSAHQQQLLAQRQARKQMWEERDERDRQEEAKQAALRKADKLAQRNWFHQRHLEEMKQRGGSGEHQYQYRGWLNTGDRSSSGHGDGHGKNSASASSQQVYVDGRQDGYWTQKKREKDERIRDQQHEKQRSRKSSVSSSSSADTHARSSSSRSSSSSSASSPSSPLPYNATPSYNTRQPAPRGLASSFSNAPYDHAADYDRQASGSTAPTPTPASSSSPSLSQPQQRRPFVFGGNDDDNNTPSQPHAAEPSRGRSQRSSSSRPTLTPAPSSSSSPSSAPSLFSAASLPWSSAQSTSATANKPEPKQAVYAWLQKKIIANATKQSDADDSSSLSTPSSTSSSSSR